METRGLELDFTGAAERLAWSLGAVAAPGGGGGGGGGVWVGIAAGLAATGVGLAIFAVVKLREAGRIARGAAGQERFASGELLADLDELSRRLAEELDEKSARLEGLIREADARIARLEGKAERGARGENDSDPVAAQVYALADRGESSMEIARKLGQHVGKVELILALRR